MAILFVEQFRFWHGKLIEAWLIDQTCWNSVGMVVWLDDCASAVFVASFGVVDGWIKMKLHVTLHSCANGKSTCVSVTIICMFVLLLNHVKSFDVEQNYGSIKSP